MPRAARLRVNRASKQLEGSPGLCLHQRLRRYAGEDECSWLLSANRYHFNDQQNTNLNRRLNSLIILASVRRLRISISARTKTSQAACSLRGGLKRMRGWGNRKVRQKCLYSLQKTACMEAENFSLAQWSRCYQPSGRPRRRWDCPC
jgi:hypothetical protein